MRKKSKYQIINVINYRNQLLFKVTYFILMLYFCSCSSRSSQVYKKAYSKKPTRIKSATKEATKEATKKIEPQINEVDSNKPFQKEEIEKQTNLKKTIPTKIAKNDVNVVNNFTENKAIKVTTAQKKDLDIKGCHNNKIIDIMKKRKISNTWAYNKSKEFLLFSSFSEFNKIDQNIDELKNNEGKNKQTPKKFWTWLGRVADFLGVMSMVILIISNKG